MINRIPRAWTGLLLLTLTLVTACTQSKQSLMEDLAGTEQRFASADEAVNTLVAALRSEDRQTLSRVLGVGSDKLISSGDEVADRNNIKEFLALYDAKHQLAVEAHGSMSLTVGENDWPMPIPLVKDPQADTWYFDTLAGLDELINRRVGRNELATIQTCLALVDAQREYAFADPDGDGLHDYALKLRSSEGKRDGLYWPTSEGQPPSPMGPLLAQATREGYTVGRVGLAKPKPYHGYHYRPLMAQGPDAPGGELDYLVKGKLLGGFALVAYPAEYGSSGVMTFIVSHSGDVYQRDLGDDTSGLAQRMKLFNPDAGWQKVDVTTLIQP